MSLFHTNEVFNTALIMIQLWKEARLNLVLGVTAAFVVLLLVTQNVVITVYAILNLICVLFMFLGFLQLGGYYIDFNVSLNLVLVVGLSVDYVVHLAESYNVAPFKSRFDRMQCSLTNLGVSICNGAATSIGALSFMLACKLFFYNTFGIFMFFTLFFSFVFTLTFFSALCFAIGPQNDCGDINAFILKLKKTNQEK